MSCRSHAAELSVIQLSDIRYHNSPIDAEKVIQTVDNNTLNSHVNGVDWSKYEGVPDYRPQKVVDTFHRLIDLGDQPPPEGQSYGSGVVHAVTSAIGNDHAGTFYPAILDAAPILVEIANHGSRWSSRAALCILDNLCASFWPEVGEYRDHSLEEVSEAFLEVLKKFRSTLRNMDDIVAVRLQDEIEKRIQRTQGKSPS